MIFKFIVYCLALAPATLVQAAPEPRAPTGKWNVSFAHAQCIALRDYGTEGGYPQLLLKASPIGEVMQVAVLRDAARTSPEETDATIAIDQHPPLKTSLMMFTPAGGVPSLDSQACALLKMRARYEPARTNDGKPAKDAVVGGIVWRMPE